MRTIKRKVLSLKRKLQPYRNLFIPPIRLNYNSDARTLRDSAEQFENFARKVIPFLVRKFNGDQADYPSSEIRLLDIGCGFSPIAYGLRYMADASATKIRYSGLDIRLDAIEWCRKTYKEYTNFEFLHHQAPTAVDYVGRDRQAHTVFVSNGGEGLYDLHKTYNLQWSCSVVTHMTKRAIINALSQISKHVEAGSLQVNTWLIIDDLSLYSMRAGIADRQLTIDAGEFLTYSTENPLVCTAYKIKTVREIYTQCGLEIVEILRGSWRGTEDNGVIYQDIVLSRKPR